MMDLNTEYFRNTRGLLWWLFLYPFLLFAAPEWDGDPGSQYHLYTFTTSLTPMNPENQLGPDSTGEATIGNYGEGWFDETDPLARTSESGAWDLGQAGTLRMTFTLGDLAATPGFGGYNVAFEMNAIVGGSPWGAPTFQPVGYTAQETGTSTTYLSSSGPVSWFNMQWTGNIQNVIDDTLQFSLIADDTAGSFVDQMEFFVIPESSTLLLVGVFCGTALLTFRRNRRR